MKEAIELLRKNPHILAIVFPKKRRIPEINLQLFRPEGEEMANYAFGLLKDFVLSHYIVDDFPNHNERRKWRQELFEQTEDHEDKIKQMLEQNGLRANRMQLPFGAIQLLQQIHTGEPARFGELAENILKLNRNDMMGKYNAMTVAEKIKHINKLNKRIFQMLEHLGKQQ